jgi:hypothetical protein
MARTRSSAATSAALNAVIEAGAVAGSRARQLITRHLEVAGDLAAVVPERGGILVQLAVPDLLDAVALDGRRGRR